MKKIESNINQYKVDRLNAEISDFSSGDLNKYEFLTRKDLKYKPNALDKTRFEFSPLGKTFSMGVVKLLKDIRDGLRGVVRPPGPDDNIDDDNNDDDNNDDDNNNNDDNDERVIIENLLNEINKIKNTNKQYNDTINNINRKNDDYLKKNKRTK